MKNFVILFALLLFCTATIKGSPLREKKADALFEKEFYYDAIKMYQKLADKGKISANVAAKLGHSYRHVNDYANAAKWYGEAVKFENIDPLVYFYYAEMLKTMEQHRQAFQWLEKYANLNPADTRATQMLNDRDYINTIDITSLYGVLTKIETGYNGPEFGLAFHDQQTVVFSSTRHAGSPFNHKNRRENSPFYNLYTASLNNWKLENISPFEGEFNSELHEGPVVFSPDGNEMFFTRNSFTRRSRFRSHKVNHLVIYRAVFDGQNYVDPQPLPFNSPKYSCGHPALSPDGKKLYFVSDMPGGMGETDIYYAERTETGWSDPVNAGQNINTKGRELFPFVAANGTLYFSSDGHVALGGLDIFSAAYNGNAFEKPVNLGAPINSTADDFGFILANDLENGFFSSNRQETSTDAFYHFKIMQRPDIFALELLFKDQETGEPLPDVAIVFLGENLDDVKTDRNGFISMNFDKAAKFRVNMQKDGYLADQAVLETRKRIRGRSLEKEEITLERITQDISFDLEIFFALGRSDISREASSDLDEIALRFLQNNPGVTVELSAHTDSRGNAESNLTLSQSRAQTARDYLVSKGIDPHRIVARGYGETKLRNHCIKGVQCTDEEHQQNRRVEIRVLSF